MNFYGITRRSIYILFASLFLMTNAKIARLQIIDSVNRPVDTVAFSTPAEPKDYLPEPSPSEIATISSSYQPSTPTATPIYTNTLASSSTSQGNSISFAGLSIPIFYTNNYMTDSGSSVGFYKNYLLYGHNSPAVFGSIPHLGAGSTVSITLNGQTTTHQVLRSITVTKEQASSYMVAINNDRHIDGDYNHNYILMTCAGTLYGNGDASHRSIVFIN